MSGWKSVSDTLTTPGPDKNDGVTLSCRPVLADASPTKCGLLGSLSTMMSCPSPVKRPMVMGLSVTVIVHDPPGGIGPKPGEVQSSVSTQSSSPSGVMLLIVRLLVPVLVSVTVCGRP